MSFLVSLVGLAAILGGGITVVLGVGEGVVAMALGGLLVATGVGLLALAKLVAGQRDAAVALDDIVQGLGEEEEDERPVSFSAREGSMRAQPRGDDTGGRSEPRL